MLAEKLKSALDKRQMSPAELARKSGISNPAIYNILNGKRTNLSSESIIKISAALDINPLYFFSNLFAEEIPFLYGLPSELQEFVLDKYNLPYIQETQRLVQHGISIDLYRKAVNLIIDISQESK